MRTAKEKIVSREIAAEHCEALRREGKTIGFTSGAFDILHAGHAEFLEKARAMCDALVVGVNTDESVRAYKGPSRPVVPQDQRVRLIASLRSVDFVFLFSERRNAQNIEALKPNFYIKAGDYTKDGLTSSDVVEKHGGKAVLIPIATATSTTDLIRKACAAQGIAPREAADSDGGEAVSLDAPPAKMSPAAFIDRDGTINPDIEYLHEPERFELLPGAAEGMKRFQDMGYRIVIVTNQAGIGLGYFTKEDFYRVNRAMFRALKPFGVAIDRIYFCPHGFSESCDCRKPGTALFERAKTDLNIDLAKSVMIGDATSDIEAARRLGMAGVLVKTGKAGSDKQCDATPDYEAESVLDAAEWMLGRERTQDTGESRP